ncbi:hypothetical protein DFA_04105 [Cavenderia fasciculata]|uniref:Uncharacterized protein n=1 Tax=Cavenderia fasciculata TaxID=261658 RepID=F4Q1B0_CACFS|nr:uncharacterized protein DFA_04105 [Cavenderia fasciculata]EGG18611.1 hypothetical protein DFA_04105 [Cavenderia fasciculata]|eukprot:XP_004366515.1 hypothetical protein DFA_04105 [Cavenderia fasciculata]
MNTPTIKSLLQSVYIRQVIFYWVGEVSNITKCQDDYIVVKPLKGRDIVNIPHLGMITQYAMPWNFIKHYLPPNNKDNSSSSNILFERRMDAITGYCAHRNATLNII